MKNFRIIILTVLSFVMMSGMQAQTVTPSKNYITREVREIKDFSSIKVVGSPDVEYRQSRDAKPTVSIYGSDNLVGLVEVSTVDGVLQVNYKKGVKILGGERRLKVIVSSASLVSVEIQGSSDVNLMGMIKGHDLKLIVVGLGDITAENLEVDNITAIVKGSGDIEMKKVKAGNVVIQVDGSGDVSAKGSAREAKLAVSGFGDISASGLVASRVIAAVSGSGDIDCYASEQLDAKITGNGDIEYKGRPSVVNKQGKKGNISGKD